MRPLLLFLLLMSQQASDACNSNKYWRQRCGDIDFHWRLGGNVTCNCGGVQNLFRNNSFSRWCCLKNTSTCMGKGNWTNEPKAWVGAQKTLAWSQGAECPDGIPVKMDDTCYGRCNYDPQNSHRAPQSTVAACKDTKRCIKETTWSVGNLGKSEGFEMSVCSGQFRCKDKGDLDWCKSEERRSEKCPILNTLFEYVDCSQEECVSYSQRCSGSLPGQCVYQIESSIQKFSFVNIFFSCLDRSDLSFTPKRKKIARKLEKVLDFDKIETCERHVNSESPSWLNFGIESRQSQTISLPGLKCSKGSEGCLPRWFWCMGRTLRIFLETKWGMPQQETMCPLLNGTNVAEDPRLCGNFNFWSKHPCPGLFNQTKVFRCLGKFSGQCNLGIGDTNSLLPNKCVDGTLQFTSSTEKCERKDMCKVDGKMVCIHEESRCNLVPLCDDGRDEVDCKEKYLRKGLIQRGADFECTCPIYNTDNFPNASIKIWAVRCDGNPQCWKNMDEQGCSLGNIIFYVLGT